MPTFPQAPHTGGFAISKYRVSWTSPSAELPRHLAEPSVWLGMIKMCIRDSTTTTTVTTTAGTYTLNVTAYNPSNTTQTATTTFTFTVN